MESKMTYRDCRAIDRSLFRHLTLALSALKDHDETKFEEACRHLVVILPSLTLEGNMADIRRAYAQVGK